MTLESFRLWTIGYGYYRSYTTVMKTGETILESSVVKFIDLPPYVFDVDHVAKIRSGLSITVLEKKNQQNYRLKKK